MSDQNQQLRGRSGCFDQKKTSFVISGRIFGIERDLMAEFYDHSVAIGDRDVLFLLPR